MHNAYYLFQSGLRLWLHTTAVSNPLNPTKIPKTHTHMHTRVRGRRGRRTEEEKTTKHSQMEHTYNITYIEER